ncbi:dihydroxyacetone kinase subunit DhaK [Euzebya tangerina]|uniref:dihydroxyacetone kinase subunit DhaK n=1 Tax=Euzebya tangerina TaxID=591198 RepID=UPI000E31C1F6|nr:dihydroxyacetone kinase subunit DhaK [Euzebya tangerina]
MDQFINDTDTLVRDAIDGVVRAGGGRLARLDGYPATKVVVRTDWDASQVAVISGGGSGHEPAHAGFVGPGMLTAAVCGEVFASPSVDAVLAGILAVTGDPGCLLIVKNYTGDRLNFGLAAERARALGKRVEMVVVDDDIALPELPQPRGLAGTLFVHKIAGALAHAGNDLDTVAEAARRTVAGVSSIGMSLDTCTVPGSPKEERISVGMAELGLGIHGEPGVDQVEFTDAGQAMHLVVERLSDHRPLTDDAGHRVALLNNLGGVTALEMGILTAELAASPVGRSIDWLVGPAPLMTSLDMRGFSLSLLTVDDDDLAALLAEPAPPAWPGASQPEDLRTIPLPDGLEHDQPEPSEHPETRRLLERCCEAMIKSEADLNELDAKSGDGDTGSTVKVAATALLKKLDTLPLADHAALFHVLSTTMSREMGGSSGVLLAILFAAAGDAADNGAGAITALQAGLQRVSEVGGAGPGDRTMIDALAPALDASRQGWSAAARAARQGAEETAAMDTAAAGRASYVSADQLRGHVDPGAEAVARLFEAL